MPSFMRYINVVGRCAAIYRADRLKDTGLAENQHSYILCVCRNPGISQDALARKLFINKSNVTRTLSQLEASGYVRREQSPEDKRVTLVYPTDKAEAALPGIRAILREWREYLTAELTQEEQAQLEALLPKLAKRAADYAAVSEEAYGDLDAAGTGNKTDTAASAGNGAGNGGEGGQGS